MSKTVILVGAVVLSTAVAGYLFLGSQSNSSEYKEELKNKRKLKKLQSKKEEQARKEEEEQANEMAQRRASQQQATAASATQAGKSEKQIQIEEYSMQQSLVARACLEAGDIDGFINAYARIVTVQEDPVSCLEELGQHLPKNAIIAIAQKVFQTEYLAKFPEKYGISVTTDDETGRRSTFAARDYAEGETVFVCEPLVAYLNYDVDVYEHCFTCKKLLEEERVKADNGFAYCNATCQKQAIAPEIFCKKHDPDLESDNLEETEKKHPFHALQELAKDSKRTLFYAIAQLYTMIDSETVSEAFREDFSHLYIPSPAPGASQLTQTEHQLLKDWINPTSGDISIYVAFVCKIIYNQISFQSKKDEQGNFVNSGKGIYPRAAFFDHSCCPSVKSQSVTGTSELTFKTTKALKKGDAMTINYIDDSLTGDERRKRLELVYDFKCDCEICSKELKEAAAAAAAVTKPTQTID